MGLLSSIGKGIAKVLDVTTVALAHPIQTATAVVSKKSTVQDVVTAHFAQPLKEQIKDIVVGTAGIAATVVGGAAIGTAAKAGTLLPAAGAAAKSLIPSTAKGKVVAAVAAPIVVGAVAKEPVKSVKAAISAPSELAQFGGDVATFAANPSVATAKEIIKESPVISAAVGAAVVGGAALKILPAVATARQTEAIQEQTKAIEQATGGITVIDKSGEFKSLPAAENNAPIPQTPQTQKVSSTTVKKRARRAKKAVVPSVNQRVNVIVANRNTSTGMKNYLKREVLLN